MKNIDKTPKASMINLLIDIIREHVDYKQQIIKLAKADLMKTYRGAALGWAWAIIKPSVTIFVYWFAFKFGMRVGKDINGYPYFLWLILGLVPWFYMNDMLINGAESLRKYKYLITKMKFPIATIPTFISVSKLVVHSILMLIIIGIFLIMGYSLDIYILQLIFYMMLMFVFFIAWTLFSSLLSAISKDFFNLIKSFTTVILWMSGILWDINNITIPWMKNLLIVNPVTFLVNGYRNCFINKVWFWEQPKELLSFFILLIIVIMLSLWAYKKLRKEIADVL